MPPLAPETGEVMKSEMKAPAKGWKGGKSQEEIEQFLAAVKSYPQKFADDPGISFGEHLLRLSSNTKKQTGK